MAKKPKLDDVMPKKKAAKKRVAKRPAKRPYSKRAELQKEMAAVWIPHFVAHSFNRAPSIRAAFPKREWSDAAAIQMSNRLMRGKGFQDQMSTHLSSLEEDLKIDENFVLAGLYRQSIANIFDYFDIDKQGNWQVRNLAKLPEALQRNIKKVSISSTVRKSKDGEEILDQRVNLDLVDSQKAYALLGTALGMFVNRHELEGSDTIAEVLERALNRVRVGKQDQLPAPEQAKDPAERVH